jgi:hypothetical protein
MTAIITYLIMQFSGEGQCMQATTILPAETTQALGMVNNVNKWLI